LQNDAIAKGGKGRNISRLKKYKVLVIARKNFKRRRRLGSGGKTGRQKEKHHIFKSQVEPRKTVGNLRHDPPTQVSTSGAPGRGPTELRRGRGET